MKTALAEAPAFVARPPDPRLDDWLKSYPASVFSPSLYQSIELMERYSIDLAIDLLERLDVIEQLSNWRSPGELCQVLSFQKRFSFPLAWLLQRLVETGCMEAQPSRPSHEYRLRDQPWQPELARLRAVGLEIDPANAATLDLLDYAASLYPAVARGEQNADQRLFEPQGVLLWLNYFHNNNSTYAVNNWIAAVAAADRLADHPRVRILEIGAGAGSASETLLRCFEEKGLIARIERYVVTEPNAFFRRRGQRELTKRYPGLPLEWGPLDLNSQWAGQDVTPQEFDLIYGVNVLHIAKDLLFSLGQARSALASDGWLVIGECLRPYSQQPLYPELMFQILESFTDVQTDSEIRPNPGFLTASQWRAAFARAGFDHPQVAPDLDSIRELYPHFFTGAICAQRIPGRNDVR